jgi:hypothetical protein
MAALSDEIKAFIVQAHACFRKPALIVREVGVEFGVTVTREQVLAYHPERYRGRRLGRKYREVFKATREAFIQSKVEVGIAYQSYRLALYQRGAEHYEELGYYLQAAELAERAAKDLGGAYTNAHIHSGPDGQAIPISLIDQKKETVARMLKKLMDNGQSKEQARATLISMGVNEEDISN